MHHPEVTGDEGTVRVLCGGWQMVGVRQWRCDWWLVRDFAAVIVNGN